MPQRLVNGVTFSFDQQGSGPTLVLLHGFPMDRCIWSGQLAGLASDANVIAPDLRGFGQSPSSSPFTIESLADDVHDLLEALNALPCVLGGLSMGGYVALAFARKYPADLRGLILVDTKAEADNTEAKNGRDEMIKLVRAEGPTAVAEKMFPKLLAPTTPGQRPDAAAVLKEMMNACPPATIENALRAMRDRDDYSGSLASIPVPVQVVVGAQDAVTPPATAENMASQIPAARLAVIPDAGHLSPMEQPTAVNRVIAEFLKA